MTTNHKISKQWIARFALFNAGDDEVVKSLKKMSTKAALKRKLENALILFIMCVSVVGVIAGAGFLIIKG